MLILKRVFEFGSGGGGPTVRTTVDVSTDRSIDPERRISITDFFDTVMIFIDPDISSAEIIGLLRPVSIVRGFLYGSDNH